MNSFVRGKYLKKIRGFYHADDIIKVITGVRRCGKSSLMLMIAEELTKSGIPQENVIFIDLDKRAFSADQKEQKNKAAQGFSLVSLYHFSNNKQYYVSFYIYILF